MDIIFNIGLLMVVGLALAAFTTFFIALGLGVWVIWELRPRSTPAGAVANKERSSPQRSNTPKDFAPQWRDKEP